MDFDVVLIERSDMDVTAIYGSSGVMLNKNYVITTPNFILPALDNIDALHESTSPNILQPPTKCLNKQQHNLKIIYKSNNPDTRIVKRAQILATFCCKNIKSTTKQTLQDWAIDLPENTNDLAAVMSLFIVLRVENSGSISDFQSCLNQWWSLVKTEEIRQGDDILIKSVPFGNRTLLDSYSKGIVSNIVGRNLSLIISDCPATPGSEGSPVYKTSSQNPIGIVVSSLCWWRGDWIGLTLIADIRPILLELLNNPVYNKTLETTAPHHRLVACIESSLLQVYCGSNWGTAVVVSAEKGILLTNSHVVDVNRNVKLCRRGAEISGTVIYKTPENGVFDLAVVRCDQLFLKNQNCKSITISSASVLLGEEVYSAGFSIFSKDVACNPSLTRGYVSQIDQSMIKTTCCVNPGMSGGAVLSKSGELLGIIVSNTKLQEGGTVYPRLNMAIPYGAIKDTITAFLVSNVVSELRKLQSPDSRVLSTWNFFAPKL